MQWDCMVGTKHNILFKQRDLADDINKEMRDVVQWEAGFLYIRPPLKIRYGPFVVEHLTLSKSVLALEHFDV